MAGKPSGGCKAFKPNKTLPTRTNCVIDHDYTQIHNCTHHSCHLVVMDGVCSYNFALGCFANLQFVFIILCARVCMRTHIQYNKSRECGMWHRGPADCSLSRLHTYIHHTHFLNHAYLAVWNCFIITQCGTSKYNIHYTFTLCWNWQRWEREETSSCVSYHDKGKYRGRQQTWTVWQDFSLLCSPRLNLGGDKQTGKAVILWNYSNNFLI